MNGRCTAQRGNAPEPEADHGRGARHETPGGALLPIRVRAPPSARNLRVPVVCGRGRGGEGDGDSDLEAAGREVDAAEGAAGAQRAVAAEPDLGFGRIVASEIEAPHILANLV